MTRARLFVLSYAILALMIALPALYSTLQRAGHRDIIENIRTPRQESVAPPSEATLESTTHAVRKALRVVPCHAALQRDLQFLLAHQGDAAAKGEDPDAIEASLVQMQEALATSLACRPLDGKTWFDYARISLEREGFGPTAKAALAMSGTVAPRESWLAQKRVALSLTLSPMLDGSLRELALRDLAVLDAANHVRLNTLLKATDTHTIEELRTLIREPMSAAEEPTP